MPKLPFSLEDYYDPAEDDEGSGLDLMPGQEGREEFVEDLVDMQTKTHTYDDLFYKKSGRRLSGEGNLDPRHLNISKMAPVGPMDAKATEKMDLETFRDFIVSEINNAIFEEIEDMDEASTTANVQAYQAPAGMSREDLINWGKKKPSSSKKKKEKDIGEKEFALEIMREINQLNFTDIEKRKLFEAGLFGRIMSRFSGGTKNILGNIGASLPNIKGSATGLLNAFDDMMGTMKQTGGGKTASFKIISSNLRRASESLSKLDDVLVETQEPFDHVVALISVLKELNVPIYDELSNMLISQLKDVPDSISDRIETIGQLIDQLSEKVKEEKEFIDYDEEMTAGKLLGLILGVKKEKELSQLADKFNRDFEIKITGEEGEEETGILFASGDYKERKIKVGNSNWFNEEQVNDLVKAGRVKVNEKS